MKNLSEMIHSNGGISPPYQTAGETLLVCEDFLMLRQADHQGGRLLCLHLGPFSHSQTLAHAETTLQHSLLIAKDSPTFGIKERPF